MADTWKDSVTLSQRLLFLLKVHGSKIEEVPEFQTYLLLWGKQRLKEMLKAEMEREKAKKKGENDATG